MIPFILAICVALLILGIASYNSELNTENIKKNFKLDHNDKLNKYCHIIDQFDDIQKIILDKINYEYKTCKFQQTFICILLAAALILISFMLETCGKNTSVISNNLLLIFLIISLVLTVLILFYLFISLLSIKKLRNYHNELIICSYQRTALLTAIQLDDKEMISKNLANLAEIDQSFFSEKKSDFE